MLGTPNGRLPVIHDLGLEQVVDGFVQCRLHLAAARIVDNVRVKRRCGIRDVHHRDHGADHGVVVQRNLVRIVATLGPHLRKPALGTLHRQKEVNSPVETCLESGLVRCVRRRFVTHGEESHFLDSRIVVDSAEVAAAFRLPFGFLPAVISTFVLIGHGLVKTAVCNLPRGQIVGILVNIHARRRRSQLRITAITVDFRNSRRRGHVTRSKRIARDRQNREKQLARTKPKTLHSNPFEDLTHTTL